MHSDEGNPETPAQETFARSAQDRLAFMVEAGNLLATSIDLETTLRNVAELAVPRLADWCAIFRAEPDGGVTRLIAAHGDPRRQRLLERLEAEYPADPDSARGHRNVIRTGEPELIPVITDEMIRGVARDAEHLRMLEELGLRSIVTVPLVVDGRVWGALSLATDQSGRYLGPNDLSLASELAARAATTIRVALLVRQLAEQRRVFRSTLSSIGDGVIACDLDGIVTFINPAAERLTGCDPASARGGAASDVVRIETAGSLHPIEDLIERVILVREEVELPAGSVLVGTNGERTPVSGGGAPIVDDTLGTIDGVVIVLHDVSAITASQYALRQSRERFRLVSDSITSHAIITLTPDASIDSWNRGAAIIFGYTAEEILGSNARNLFTPEDQARGISELELEQATKTGRASDDRWMLRKNHVRFFASGVTTPLVDERGRIGGFVKVLQDQTEQKLLMEEVERAKTRAEHASQAKTHFLATLSHELRTPLTPVLTAVQLLADDPQLTEQNSALLQMMARNIEIEARLIDDLLDVTRIASGKLQLQLGAVDVHEILVEALEICSDQINGKEHRIAVDLDAEQHTVRGDAGRLQQVFWNLLTNAVKFTPDGGEIAIRTANHDGRISISIRDSGIGIAPDLVSKVFSVFEQGDASVTKRFGGLGLGLSISRAIVQVHGGSIRAESMGPGTGTTFTVELPVES